MLLTKHLRKDELKALRQTVKFFENLLQVSADGIVVTDASQNIVIVNKTFCDIFSCRPTEVVETSMFVWLERFDNNALERWIELEKKVHLETSPMEAEFRLTTKDGEKVLSVQASPLEQMSEEDSMVILSIWRDVTERRKIEWLMKESQQKVVLLNSIADVFLTVADDDTMYSEILNIVLEALNSKYGVFGYIDEDGAFVVPSMTRHIWDQCQVRDKRLLFPEDTWGESTWPRAIREKIPICVNEQSILTPEGHISIKRHISLPIIHHDEVIGLFQVANKETDYDDKDIETLESIANYVAPILNARLQRDRKEEERRRADQALEVANKELEAFSYSVSHDLRAPLRALDGFSVKLLDRYSIALDDKGQHYLHRIRAATERMGILINDLLKLSRVSRAEVSLQDVDLSSMSHEIAAELQESDLSRQVQFIIEDGLIVTGDERLLKVMMTNLLSNAWKFTGKLPTARIKVGMTRIEGIRTYFVRDDGAGFSMEYVGRLFNPFQRLHTVNEFEGTGVGLATVQRIIRRHGGTIWAEGAVEEGATFYFTLDRNQS